MKFTKTALAVAFAGMAAAPLAQADVTLSGYVGVILGSSDADDAELTLASDDSTINVHATHELNNGLTGYGTVRFDGGLTDDVPVSDGIKVGVKGGFGDFRMGDTFNPVKYGQQNDILTDIGDTSPIDGVGDLEEQAIGYEGSFGPATVGIVWSPAGNRDLIGAGIKFNFGGFSFGAGGGTADVGTGTGDSLTVGSVGAKYSFGGGSIGVGYKEHDTFQSIEAVGSFGVGAASVKLSFETISSDFAEDGDSKIRLDVGYGLGGGMEVSTRINVFTDDSDSAGDETDYRVMLTKSF